MSVVTITLGGVNVTPVVLFKDAIFVSQVNGKPGTARFRIRDEAGTATYDIGAELLLTIDGNLVWGGYATSIKRVYVFPAVDVPVFGTARFFDVLGVDWNILFQRRIVFNQDDPAVVLGTLFPVGTPDTTAITDLLANFLDLSGDGLDTSSGVENVGNITVNQEGRAWQGSDRWGDAMTSIARIPGAIFYITPDKVFKYVDDDTADAPFGLSDMPDGVDTKRYREMEFLVDGTGLANDVLGWGIGYGSRKSIFQRVADIDSIIAHGLWQDSKTYVGVFEQDTLDANVNSIVFGSPLNLRGAKDDKIAVTLTTFEPGFQPAQKVIFWSNIFDEGRILPIRKMTIRFPAPDTPKYELVLSHEIDTPFDIIDNLLFDLRLPPIPPILFPPPPPPVPISCGITDTFNRPDAGSLGIADCGRLWSVQFADPMTIEDDLMRVPTGIAGDRSSSLPGSYPVPFNGRIAANDADIHPGFTYVTTRGDQYGFGPAWLEDYGGYVDGTEVHIGGNSILPHLNGGSAVGTDSLAAQSNRRHYDPESPVTITGYLRMVETDSGTVTSGDRIGYVGPALDAYIRLGMSLYVSIVESVFLFGDPPGSPDVACLFIQDGTGAYVSVDFPANFWRDVGECAFEITYTGGVDGTVTATFGATTASMAIDASSGLPGGAWGATNSSFNHDDPWGVPCSELDLSNVLINDTAITDLNWEWHLEGTTLDANGVLYRFGYVSMGGRCPFDFGYAGEPELWPYTIPSPAIWAYRFDVYGEQLSVFPLDDDLTWPFTPVVTIIGTTATLAIGAASVSVTTTSPVAALGDSFGGLGHYVRNGQGEWVTFNDLDVIGVNNCTEIAAPGQWLTSFFIGDGTTDTFTLLSAFSPGATALYVDGRRLRLGDDYTEDPAAGTVTFATAPDVGTTIAIAYFPFVVPL